MSTTIQPTDPSCSPLPLPAPEMVQEAPSLTIAELGHYWADLTTKEGACLKNFSLNGCTELEFAIAYEAGKASLPPGDDALLAYFFNATPLYLAHFQKYPPAEKRELKIETELCQYLLTSDMSKSRCALQVIGSLNPQCRRISDQQLQVPCADHLFLQTPLDYENSLNFIHWHINQRDHDMFQVLVNGLNLFTPDEAQHSPCTSAACPDSRLMDIYLALKQKKDHWASLRFLSLLATGGYNPIDSKTVLDLPDQLTFIEKMKQFDKLMPRLKSAYKNSRFVRVIEAACSRPAAPRQAAVEALRVCSDAEVLAFAWRLEDEKRVDFLLEAASTIPEEALPFALNHLITLCKTETHVRLVGAYLERLMRAPAALRANYESTLVRLLSKHQTSNELLSAHPNVMQHYFPDLRPLLNIATAGQLMDQMSECYAHVTDTTIVRDLADLLVREKADSALWSKFKTLLTTLVQDGRFVDEVIVVFETVAAAADAVGCFEVTIPQLAKRKPDQKQRIARAYAAAIQLQSDPRTKDRMIGAFADGWLLGQLRKDESWEAFAHLLLYSCAKKDFKDPKVVQGVVQDALWIAPRLLEHDPCHLFSSFEAQVQRFPNRCLVAEEWKPHLARMLVRNPRNSQVLTKLVELAGKAEKRVLQECQKKGETEVIRGCMNSYLETGTFTIPKPTVLPLSEQFQNALQSKKLPLALTLLQKMAGPEWELWRQFIGCLPEKPDHALAEQAWAIWLEKHPIGAHKAEDIPYWKEAIQRILTNVASTSPVLSDFIITRAEKYVAVLGRENSEVLMGSCQELGIAACWNKQTTQPAAILRALLPFRSHALQIKDHFVGCFYLMLANQAEPDLYEVGNRWVLERAAELPLDVEIFKAYSLRPYFPKSVEDQTKILAWIASGLQAFHAQLSWIEKHRIFSALCSGSLEKHSEDQKIHHFANLGVLWDNLLITFPQAQSTNSKCSDYFFSATLTYIDAAMKHLPSKILRHNILAAARNGFLKKAAPFGSQAASVTFRLHNCFNMLSLLPFDFPDDGNIIATCLVDLNDCFIHFIQNSKAELPTYVTKLLFYITRLLNHPKPDVSVTLRTIFENLMESPLIVKANAPVTYNWTTILHTLGLAILQLQPDRRAEAVKMIAKLFSYCTRPSLDKQFVDSCVDMLGSLFFANPHLELLSDEDWKGLIEGQSTRSVRSLMTILRTEIEKMALERTYTSSVALAQLICHANPNDKVLLNELVQHCALGTGTHFKNLCGICESRLNLQLHSQWIRAISSLSKKCVSKNVPIDRTLAASKITMTVSLTTAICALIVDSPSYDLYIPFLREALTGDHELEVAKLIYSLIPESQVVELNNFKENLGFVINLVKK